MTPQAFRVQCGSGQFELELKRSHYTFLIVAGLILGMLPAIAMAQATADPVGAARVRLGRVGITPGIAMSSGVDTNVFNQDENPKDDWVTTVAPQADVWFRLGPARVELRNGSSFTNFKQYTDQGGFSTRHAARIDLPVNRVNLFVDQSFMTVRERPSIEIDTRVRRREDVLIGGFDLRAGSKTVLRVDATRRLQTFEEEAAFEGVNLAAALNRRSEVGGLSLRHQATALTTFVVLAEGLRERFVASSIRDSDSIRVTPGVEFDPRALIGGRAFVGYRRFIIRSGVAPRFTGVVASVELASTIRSTTRFSVRANRDVAYSYDVTSPYYLLASAGVSVVHRFGQNWDLGVAVGRDNLNYERWTIPPATVVGAVGLPPRFETVDVLGGSGGYRLGDHMRLAVSYDYSRRTSTRLRRPYEGAKILSQFIYGS